MYYQQLHLEYWCNLARYWLQAPWGWHDSVETCRSVIICEIIVHLLVIVQNNKRCMIKSTTTETPGWSYRKRIQPFGLTKYVKPCNWCQNTSVSKSTEITHKTTCTKPMWNIVTVNCITNSCIWNACVTWQGIDYKLTEDDTIVSKHVAVW